MSDAVINPHVCGFLALYYIPAGQWRLESTGWFLRADGPSLYPRRSYLRTPCAGLLSHLPWEAALISSEASLRPLAAKEELLQGANGPLRLHCCYTLQQVRGHGMLLRPG